MTGGRVLTANCTDFYIQNYRMYFTKFTGCMIIFANALKTKGEGRGLTGRWFTPGDDEDDDGNNGRLHQRSSCSSLSQLEVTTTDDIAVGGRRAQIFQRPHSPTSPLFFYLFLFSFLFSLFTKFYTAAAYFFIFLLVYSWDTCVVGTS